MSANTAPIGPFVGINNRLPDHQLGIVERGRKAGDYLRNAVNVDLTAAGTLQRRKGSTLAVPGTRCMMEGVLAGALDHRSVGPAEGRGVRSRCGDGARLTG